MDSRHHIIQRGCGCRKVVLGESREDNIDKAELFFFFRFVGGGESTFTRSTEEEESDNAEIDDSFCFVTIRVGFKPFCEALEEIEVGWPDAGSVQAADVGG